MCANLYIHLNTLRQVDLGLAVTDGNFSSALEVDDMIMCINGKEGE